MIPKILSIPVTIARSAALGAVRLGFGGVVAVAGKLVAARGHQPVPTTAPSPVRDTEPVTPPPAPAATTAPAAEKAPAKKAPAAKRAPAAKKAPAKKAPAKKSPAKKAPSVPPTPADVAAHTKPAAVLNEDLGPVDDDPVVYTSGPS